MATLPASKSGTVSFAVGGTDHAVYKVTGDPSALSLTQTLYTKTAGHTEWVSCVAATSVGAVISGGMDSKLLLWHPHRPTCTRLAGHLGPITHIHIPPSTVTSTSVFSTSYDGTIRRHDLRTTSELGMWGGDLDGSLANDYMAATRNPMLGLCLHNDRITGCTRDGRLVHFDAARPSVQPITAVQAHRGPTRTVIPDGDSGQVVISAGNQEGAVKRFDLRIDPSKGRCVRKVENLHAGGVTNMVRCGDGNHIVTAGGGDGAIRVLDPSSLKVVAETQFVVPVHAGDPAASVYDLRPYHNTTGIVAAWGDGRVLICHDTLAAATADPDRPAVWFDAREQGIKNALKAVHVVDAGMQGEVLVGAGDDGFVVSWQVPPQRRAIMSNT
ncbi:WD40-repeat-containing domain protein [Powellomyces hirtus]|nr:WD40-repeat-containing domain protein [Powellomyces hirtus]